MIRSLAILALCAGCCACGLNVFDITVTETGGAGMAAIQFPGMDQFSTGLANALAGKNVNPNDVNSLKVDAVTLTMTSQGGLTKDLSFLHDLTFTVSATGMSPALLASMASFPAGTTKANLTIAPNVELKPYLKAGGMMISVSATLNPPPPDKVDLQVDFKLRVDAHVI